MKLHLKADQNKNYYTKKKAALNKQSRFFWFLQLKEFYDKNHKWKKDLFFNIIINLKKSGFHIFKSGDHKKMYACPVKPKKFKEEELSKICYSIIQMVKENIKISKKVLINSDFNQNISKDSILYELKWLLKEGYIKEFKDGQISIN